MSKILEHWEHGGFQCRALQGPASKNGYVAIPAGHPWHGKHYDDIAADVHGGLTFAAYGGEDSPWPDEKLWWIGFDTAHYDSGHWSIGDIIKETNNLAKQAAAANGSTS